MQSWSKNCPSAWPGPLLLQRGPKKTTRTETWSWSTGPNLAIQKVLTAVAPKRYYPAAGVHATAVVDETATLGEGVAIGPYVVIGPKSKIGAGTKIMAHTVIGGEVEIGENCLFYPHCIIGDYIKIGNRCILQQGASLGSDGFGYVTVKPSNLEKNMAGQKDFSSEPNPFLKIPQTGNVVLADDVEIGAYATIDRATMGSTYVGEGSKIDNLVMIAHNNRIGRENLIIACVSVGGSCVLGDRVVVGGGSSLSDHLTLGDDAVLSGGSGAMKDIPAGDIHAGTPCCIGQRLFYASGKRQTYATFIGRYARPQKTSHPSRAAARRKNHSIERTTNDCRYTCCPQAQRSRRLEVPSLRRHQACYI